MAMIKIWEQSTLGLLMIKKNAGPWEENIMELKAVNLFTRVELVFATRLMYPEEEGTRLIFTPV